MPGFGTRIASRRGSGGAVAAVAAVLAVAVLSADAVGAGFPVSVTDDRGVVVRLPRSPERIVSLAPSLTEIVFLLGMQGRLAGVTRFCDHPPEASALPRVGGIVDPDLERIVASRPDLVLCTTDGNPKEKVNVLEEMGIPCFAVGPQDLRAVLDAIERIGTLLGVPEKARRETGSLRTRMARVSRPEACGPNGTGPPEESGRIAPRVLFAVSTSPVIVAGKGTFLDEMIRISGGNNAAGSFSGRYPRLSAEDLVAASPDIILVAAMAGVERFPEALTRWKEIPAFRDGEVRSLDGDLVTRPGPRMVDALEEVSRILAGWCSRKAPARTAGGRAR